MINFLLHSWLRNHRYEQENMPHWQLYYWEWKLKLLATLTEFSIQVRLKTFINKSCIQSKYTNMLPRYLPNRYYREGLCRTSQAFIFESTKPRSLSFENSVKVITVQTEILLRFNRFFFILVLYLRLVNSKDTFQYHK